MAYQVAVKLDSSLQLRLEEAIQERMGSQKQARVKLSPHSYCQESYKNTKIHNYSIRRGPSSGPQRLPGSPSEPWLVDSGGCLLVVSLTPQYTAFLHKPEKLGHPVSLRDGFHCTAQA
jgi:hypothetical protein